MNTQSCDFKLAADMVANCKKPSIKGLQNNAYIINRNDIDFESSVRDEENPYIITNLVLQSGKKAFRLYVPGKTPYTGTAANMVEGTYRNNFDKTFNFVVLDNGPDVVRDIINPLANGEFVVIMENKYSGEDNKNTYEVYGFEQGLRASAIANDKYSDDSEGGWSGTLTESGAPSAGLYLFNQTVAATKTAIDSLVTGK